MGNDIANRGTAQLGAPPQGVKERQFDDMDPVTG